MNEESLLTPEIKTMIGQEVKLPGTEIVDRSTIRRFAHAISDTNPLYINDEYSKKTPYGGIIAPPTFMFEVSNNIFAEVGEDGRDISRVMIPGLKLARGGNEYYFFNPVRPGDILNRKRKIIDVYEKETRKLGKTLFIVSEITVTNQEDEILGINRETLIFFK